MAQARASTVASACWNELSSGEWVPGSHIVLTSAPMACANGGSRWASVARGFEGLGKRGERHYCLTMRSVNQAMVRLVIVPCVIIVGGGGGLRLDGGA